MNDDFFDVFRFCLKSIAYTAFPAMKSAKHVFLFFSNWLCGVVEVAVVAARWLAGVAQGDGTGGGVGEDAKGIEPAGTGAHVSVGTEPQRDGRR